MPRTSCAAEDLEEGELDVAQVALVVAHQGCPPVIAGMPCRRAHGAVVADGLLPAGHSNDATRQ